MTWLEIIAPGPRSTVQDGGRAGWRRFGVPTCGASDASLWRLCNAVAGAPDGAAAIEFTLRGPVVRAVGGSVRVALGGARGRADGGDGRAVAPLRSVTLCDGETLVVGGVEAGCIGYLAVAGGFDPPPALGSRATDLRAGFGGVEGRALKAGDRLAIAGGAPAGPERAGRAPSPIDGALRVLPGPQVDHFTDAARHVLFATAWRVSDQVDRMGARLLGPRLEHSALGADLMSEGLTRGAIQVPGDGAPIILGVDSSTIGGYPKIATVISADLPRVGQLVAGATLRFAAVTLAEAVAARATAEAALAAAIAAVAPARDGPDLAALMSANLVSGAVDALSPQPPEDCT